MNKIYFITYHYVRPIKNSKYPNLKGLEIKKFRSQLNLLKKKFNILNIENLTDIYINNKKKLKKRRLCLNF